MLHIAINGFGRIGRAAFKIALKKKNLEVVAINDLTDNETLVHLLKHDTVFGLYPEEIKARKKGIIVAGKLFKVFAEKDPIKLPWQRLKVDVILECTGRFRKKEEAGQHLKAGAKLVIISAPAKGEGVKSLVLGVNENDFDPETDKVVSNASCTTNSVAPVMAVLQSAFGVKKAMLTTIHSYTADQNLVDGPHKDLRRARAAAQNIVPTTTGAAKAATESVKELKDKFDGMAVRVPTVNVSLSDITALLKRPVTVPEINNAFKRAAKNPRYQGVLAVTNEPLVSSDFIENPYSTIVDLSLTKVVDKDLVKIIAWYDNEWGYACRLVELAEKLGKKLSKDL